MLWAVGAGLAGSTGVLAAARSMGGYALLYLAVAAALGALAFATRRGSRAAGTVTFVLLGSQVIGTAGAAWELAVGNDEGAKARHLHDLGVNYRLALAANLAYSAVASILFAWLLARRRATGVR